MINNFPSPHMTGACGIDTAHNADDPHPVGRELVTARNQIILARRKAEHPECKTCQSDDIFQPPHDASPRCESGKRNHCSCDACF